MNNNLSSYDHSDRPFKDRPFTQDMNRRDINEEMLQNQRVITKNTTVIKIWIQVFGWASVISVVLYVIFITNFFNEI